MKAAHSGSSSVGRLLGPAGHALAAGFVLSGLIFSAAMALRSAGVHHEDDLKHLQMARWAWNYPAYLLDDWARPGFTALYAIPAHLGWLPARLFSGFLTAATAWLAYLIAARLRVRLAALAPLFVWLQPLAFTLSYTTLTETALAFYLALALWLYLAGRFALSAATISLCAVTRHEAGLFLFLGLLALLYRGRPWRDWVWLLWAPLLHNALAFALLRELPLLLLLHPSPTREYGHGTLLTMLTLWTLGAGFGPLLLAAIGTPTIARRRGGLLLVSTAAAYFVAHSLMYALGLFASGGYARFLVPLAPVVAVCAAEALSRFQSAWRHRRRQISPHSPRLVEANAVAFATLLALWLAAALELQRMRPDLVANRLLWAIPLLHTGALLLALLFLTTLVSARGRSSTSGVMLAGLTPVIALAVTFAQPFIVAWLPPPFRQCAPLRLNDRELAYRTATAFARTVATARCGGSPPAQCEIFSASPWVDEFLHRIRPPSEPPLIQLWQNARAGDLLIWDARQAASPRHGLPLANLTADPSLVELWRSPGDPYDPVYCAVFQKQPRPEPPH